MTYGAVAVEEEPQKLQGFKKTVLSVFVGVCVVGAIVGLSATGMNSTAQTVNANRNKGSLAAVPGVMEKTQEVMNMTKNGLRYSIFSFIPCCEEDCKECKIIPTVQGKASDDWTEDWQSFTNALPENDVAAAVYNFEYFTGESSTANKPILITWAPAGEDNKELARAGYYLGSVILATDGVHSHYPLQAIGETYMTFCTETLGIDEDDCGREGDFHNCPFVDAEGVGTEGNPCAATECDGAAFTNPDMAADEGTVPEECCTLIDAFCKDPENFEEAGCHPVTMRAMTRLCMNIQPDETPEVILPADELQECEDACIQPCAFFETDDATWQQCSGCRTDGLVDTETGLSYQCYPHAIGFEENRCCGMAEECQAVEAQNDMTCNTLEEFECQWLLHSECPDLVAQQVYDAAPSGCCDAADAVKEPDCEGTFTADAICADLVLGCCDGGEGVMAGECSGEFTEGACPEEGE